MASKSKYRSDIARSAHETVQALRRIGLVDEKTMRRFDSTCLTADQKLTSKTYKTVQLRRKRQS
jgi:DNA-binding transcriptional regulator YiaG